MHEVIHGDCIEQMRLLPDNSIDSIVTDPPYELGFMGKSWDSSGIAYSKDVWTEALRVLKPGGHLLAFSGSRTYHRMACAIEDAGFEIRDQMMWIYGSGFPKSHNVAKAIEAQAKTGSSNPEAMRRAAMGDGYEPTPLAGTPGYRDVGNMFRSKAEGRTEWERPPLELTTAEAQQWEGWGTALKPAHEPIVMARKPLAGTVAASVLLHGTGALNIDGCRIGHSGGTKRSHQAAYARTPDGQEDRTINWARTGHDTVATGLGRFPANVLHDGSDEVLIYFPETRKDGSAARFFYCPKASRKDRDEGLEPGGNVHATVKPTDLMRYLVRLVTPPSGTVLDPFCGSGSTGKAAVLEGFDFIGIELDADYCAIAEARIKSLNL